MAGFQEGVRDKLGSLSFAFGFGDGGDLLLFDTLDDEPVFSQKLMFRLKIRPHFCIFCKTFAKMFVARIRKVELLLALGILEGDLLFLNGLGEFLSVIQVSNRDVVELNEESLGALDNRFTDLGGDLFSLLQQGRGGVTGHDGLEDFVSDGGEDAVVVIATELLMELGQLINLGLEQHTEMDVDHLKILGTSGGLDQLGADGAVVRLRSHKPRDLEMSALAVNFVANTTEDVKHYRTLSAIDIEKERVRLVILQ